jgi:hypothetical protein
VFLKNFRHVLAVRHVDFVKRGALPAEEFHAVDGDDR